MQYDEQFIMGPDLRVMVLGAAGRLGAAVVVAFSGAVVISQSRATLDVTKPDGVARGVGLRMTYQGERGGAGIQLLRSGGIQ